MFVDVIDVNECNKVPDVCNGNGNCQNMEGSFTCTCNPGYGGPTCGTGK